MMDPIGAWRRVTLMSIIGFLAMVTFLGVNGESFEATDADVVTTFLALAAGEVTEDQLADWIRRHSRRSRR